MRQLLETVYRDHRQGLYTLALSIVGDPHRAEDAVHEAFAHLCRRAEPPTGDPVAYVFASVRNAAIDQVRRSPVLALADPQALFAAAPATAGTPEHAAADRERDRALRQALANLPAEQREAVVLRLYAGLSFQQIAELRGEPLTTIASRYRRALDRLKSAVESLV